MHVLLPRSARGKDPCREACVAAQDTAITGRKSDESQARVSIIPANSHTKVSGSSFSQWCTGLRGKPSSRRHLQIYNGLRGDPAIASSSRGHSYSPSSHELESQHLSSSPAALYRRVSAADVGILQIWMIVGIASVVCGWSPVLDTSMRTTVMPCPCTAKKARSKQGWAHRPRRPLVEHTLHCISPRFAGRKVENNSRQRDLQCSLSPEMLKAFNMRTTVMPCPCTAKKARSKQGWAHRPRRPLVEHTLHCISPRFAGRKVENNSRQRDL